MINCILIQNNDINEIKVKNLSEETIYKKCNFKTDTDFGKLKDWNYKDNLIELWGKKKGFSNSLSSFKVFQNIGLSIYGKSIFLMKNNKNKYVTFSKDNFINFFNLNEDNEGNKVNKGNEVNEGNEDNEGYEDLDSDYSYNSELTYELYEYTDDE